MGNKQQGSKSLMSTSFNGTLTSSSSISYCQVLSSTTLPSLSTSKATQNGQANQLKTTALNRRCSELRPITPLISGTPDPPIEKLQNNGNKLLLDVTRQSRRRWSSVAQVGPRNAMKPKRLLPRQCHLIIKSWNKKAQKVRIAREIFNSIFTEADELKRIFGVPVGAKGKKLRTDSKFIAHTNLFADTLDFAVRNLDDLALVTENAEQLGRRHAIIFLPIDTFRTEYWNIFTECIIENVVNDSEDKETQLAWRQFVSMLIFYMKNGFERETLRVTRNASMRRQFTTSSIPL